MASADEIYITITGKGGHGAMPQDCIDPVTIAAQMITALQQVISRQLDQTVPALLTFGSIIANGSTNIIPNEVKIKGTFRCMNEEWRMIAHEKMHKMGVGIVEAMDGKCDFKIIKGYPCLRNDEPLTAKVKDFAIEYLGEENVVDLPLRMTAEDFSYYSQEMPATFYRLGTGNVAKGITSPVHTDTFDIDELALVVGVGLMAWLAIKELGN
jgi:amidohydrolase